MINDEECEMDGLLLIDKPKGWTSFDVVNYVRSIVARVEGKKPRQVKVGHTGTLDPSATGLLVLCVGSYTKKVPELIKHDKTYEAEVTFGATSSTGDAEGEIEKYEVRSTRYEVERQDLEVALKEFVGEVEQVPPKYSALKVNGKKAYELAREGKEVKLKPRRITVHSIELNSYTWPRAHITCSVSSGTYIRVLAEDIGEKLEVGAYLSALRRTVVDSWHVEDAVDPKSLNLDNIRDKLLA